MAAELASRIFPENSLGQYVCQTIEHTHVTFTVVLIFVSSMVKTYHRPSEGYGFDPRVEIRNISRGYEFDIPLPIDTLLTLLYAGQIVHSC